MSKHSNTPPPPVDEATINAVLADPTPLLTAAAEGQPGWSDVYGGTKGVAYLTGRIQEDTRARMRKVAALRAAAVATMLREESLAAVGRFLGVSKSAIQKVHREGVASSSDNPYYGLVTKEDSW